MCYKSFCICQVLQRRITKANTVIIEISAQGFNNILFTLMVKSLLPLQTYVLMGGRSLQSPWYSTTARMAFWNRKYSNLKLWIYTSKFWEKIVEVTKNSACYNLFANYRTKQKNFSEKKFRGFSIARSIVSIKYLNSCRSVASSHVLRCVFSDLERLRRVVRDQKYRTLSNLLLHEIPYFLYTMYVRNEEIYYST